VIAGPVIDGNTKDETLKRWKAALEEL